jgi:gliding motility-associated-like protein
MKRLLFSFFVLLSCAINYVGYGQTTSTFDFNTVGDLTRYFNQGGSTTNVTESATGGINNSRRISVTQTNTNEVFVTKQGYVNGGVGSVYEFTTYFKSVWNSGYGGVGFTTDANATYSNYAYPTNSIGISVHGGGYIFNSGDLTSSGSWTSSISDLLNSGSPDDWYKVVFTVTQGASNVFDLVVKVYSANSDGTLIRSAPDATQTASFTNATMASAPVIYSYFAFGGSRIQSFDNYSINLEGSTIVEAGFPIVTGSAVKSGSSINLSGNVTSDRGSTVTERGFVYSSSNNEPTITDSKVVVGSGTGAYTSTLVNNGQTYHIRAYATNAQGTSYGSVSSIVPPTLTKPANEILVNNTINNPLGDFILSGFEANDVIEVAVGLENYTMGSTFTVPTNAGLTLTYGYTSWTNVTTVGFTGTQSAVNTALASIKLNAGAAGTSNLNVTARLYSAGVALNAYNGHFYKFVAGNISYANAKANAAASTYLGVSGYLASITSAGENDFINSKIEGASNIWFALSDAAEEGVWRIDAGPEEGTVVWNGVADGSAPSGQYANWSSGEPNDYSTGEDYAVTAWNNGTGWNDYGLPAFPSITDIGGYVIEYGDGTGSSNQTFTGVLNESITITTSTGVVVSSFTPEVAGQGDTVVITGFGFNTASAVKFGGVAAASYTIDSDTQITAVVGSAASGDVFVQNTLGTDSEAGFTFKIAEYLFEGNVLDNTGANNDGSVSGPVTFGVGAEGQAVCFDRTNSNSNFVVLPNDLIKSESDFTISMRFKTTDKGVMLGYQNVAVDGNATNYIPILVVQSDGKLRSTLWTTDARDMSTVSNQVVNDGNWHKVDMAVTPTSITIYIDEVLAGTTTSGTVAHLDMSFNQIGRGRTDATRDSTGGGMTGWVGFTGCIDNFVLIDKGLSLAQIQEVTAVPLPTIASISVSSARLGQSVVITGTNFSGATQVLFGGTAASSFTIDSATQITAVVGAGATGSVSVNTAGGTATIAGFTFLATPNNSLDFDGVDDFVQIGSPMPLSSTTDFTIEAWVKPELIDSGYHGFIGRQATPTRSPSMWVGPYGSLHTDSYSGSDRYDVEISNFFTTGVWTHVAWVRSGNTYKYYKNGVEVFTRTAPSSINIPVENIWIGKVDNFFKGELDEVRIWNVAKSVDDITDSIGVELTGNESNLVAYYSFNQGVQDGNNTSISTLNNIQGTTALNGTLTSFARTTANSNFTAGVWPVIFTQPVASLAPCVGGTTSNVLSVGAVGPQLTYQWYSNTSASTTGATAISGATSSSYTVPTSQSGTKYYYVIVTDEYLRDITSTISSVVVSQQSITGDNEVNVGETITLTGSGTAASSNPWVSSDTSVLTVNASGEVTGVGEGTATVTYTSNTGCTATLSITVELGISTITAVSSPIANVGTTVTITGTNFANVSAVQIGTATTTFTIVSPTSITAIIPSGVFSGTIQVTTPNGQYTGGSVVVNYGPTAVALSQSSIVESAASGAVVGSFSATDANGANDTYTYTLVSGTGSSDNASFTIVGNSIKTAAALDFETKASYSIRVRVTDQGGLTFEQVFTVVVLEDTDGDGIDNSLDTDDDGDGVLDGSDNCPLVSNANQADFDADGQGDVCDDDIDGDGLPNAQDPNDYNTDTDGDGIPDAADADVDGDGTTDGGVVDTDGDGIPDYADADADGDGVIDAGQVDTDGDGIVDAYDPLDNNADDDGDGIPNGQDADVDGDGVVDNGVDTDGDGVNNANDPDMDGDGQTNEHEIACGSNPLLASSKALDTDGDNIPNCVDADDDGDGVLDSEEAVCGSDPLDADDTPIDTDRDGNPDCIDSDDDGDGVLDADDEFPLDGTEWADADGDGIGNNADTDDDNDGFSDADEIAVGTDPLDANDVPADGDGDGIPDALDNDLDNDGVTNDKDAFPLDATETMDTDGDGIGDNADMDDDNDGISDSDEVASGTNPKDANSKPRDLDGDGIPDALDADIDGDGVANAQDAFPYDRTESVDTDGDGLGNNLDPDDDNDGVLDANDANPLSANSGKDTDGDGVADEQDNDVDNDGFADDLGEVSGFLSPQTSGIESKWVVANIKQYPLSRVAIYDRNGNEVFSAVNYQNDWDGTYKDTGKRVPAGPYLYRITLSDGTKAREGWMYIIY